MLWTHVRTNSPDPGQASNNPYQPAQERPNSDRPMTLRTLLATLAATAIIAVAWLAGETHRANCQRDGNTSCTILPWDNGNPQAGGDTELLSCRDAERVRIATGHRPACR